MKRYYDIRPVVKKGHYNSFDTIKYVAKLVGMPDPIFVDKYFGCWNEMDLLFELCGKQIIYPFFNSNRYITRKLNQILIEHDIPLRISQEAVHVRVRHDGKN